MEPITLNAWQIFGFLFLLIVGGALLAHRLGAVDRGIDSEAQWKKQTKTLMPEYHTDLVDDEIYRPNVSALIKRSLARRVDLQEEMGMDEKTTEEIIRKT